MDPRWDAVQRAKPEIVALLADSGVSGVQVVAALPDQPEVWIWLCTDTDAERDALPAMHPHLEAVRAVLGRAGYPAADLATVWTTAQSQETVDRDYGASWFYALR